MVGKFEGTLIGLREADREIKKDDGTKESKHWVMYDILVTGRKKDPNTGLYTDESRVVTVTSETPSIAKPKYGMAVVFYGESREFKDKNGNPQSFMRYMDVEEAKA